MGFESAGCRANARTKSLEPPGSRTTSYRRNRKCLPIFQYACPICTYKGTYDRSDLVYQDDAVCAKPGVAKMH